MPTSQTGASAKAFSGGHLALTGEPIPTRQLAYFRERLKGRIFSFIISALRKQQRKDPTITKAAIARRLGRRPEQINRWLSGPSNLTAESISDLVLAICGGEPSLETLRLHATALDTLNEEAARVPGDQTMSSVDADVAGAAPRSDSVDIPPVPLLANGPSSQQNWLSPLIQPNIAASITEFFAFHLPPASYPGLSGVFSPAAVFSQSGLRRGQTAHENSGLRSKLVQLESALAQAQKENEELRHEIKRLRQILAVRISGASYLQQEAILVRLETPQPPDIAIDESSDPLAWTREQPGKSTPVGFSA